MADLAIIGNSEFVMGFELIGIKKIYAAETKEKLKDHFLTAMKDNTIGVIVTNDKALDKLEPNFRRTVETLVTPVLVVLSMDAMAQDNLKDMIKKAIGIDLWSK